MSKDVTVKQLRECGQRLSDIALEYWQLAQKAGVSGAVIWTLMEDGRLVIVTRGEYQATLLKNIHDVGSKRIDFGSVSEE